MRRAAAVLAMGLLAAGCGKKLPPVPPLLAIPARVEPLAVAQQGSDAVLRFPYPTSTQGGEPLSGLSRVTVYREIVSASAVGPPPPPPTGALREREEKLFLMRAEKIRELERGQIDEATAGSDLVVRDPLSSLFTDKRLGKVVLRYGVTASRDRKKTSELSPLVSIRPVVPPSAPRGLSATVGEGRVCVEWGPPDAMLDGAAKLKVSVYTVYRREALGAEAIYDEPVATVAVPWYLDVTTRPDRKYAYTVRAAPLDEKPLALGPPAEEAFADTRDVFPPAAPEGFQVLIEAGGNRLVWNPVSAPDLATYHLYRRATGGWQLLPFEGTDTTTFDAGAPPDAVYAVSAVDRSGNESARTEGASGRPEAAP